MPGKIITGGTSAAKVAAALTPQYFDQIMAQKEDLLRPFHGRLCAWASAPCDILLPGDSTTEGARCTNQSTRWIGRLTTALRQAMGQTSIKGGIGYVPAVYATGDMNTPSPSQFYSGGVPVAGPSSFLAGFGGLGRKCMALNGSVASGGQKMVLTCTAGTASAASSVDCFYMKSTTNPAVVLNIYVDGTQVTSINTFTSGLQSGGNRYRVTGLDPSANHTIEMRSEVSGTNMVTYVEGWMLYNGDENAGIRFWDAGSSGSNVAWHRQATDPVSKTGTPYVCCSADTYALIRPALSLVGVGINSYYDSTNQTQTPAATGTDYAALIANLKALGTYTQSSITYTSTIVPWLQWERSTPGGLASPWSAYRAAEMAVIKADPTLVPMDIAGRLPRPANYQLGGLFNTDNTHTNDAGDGLMAYIFLNYLLPT